MAAALTVTNLQKSFYLPTERPSSLKQAVIRFRQRDSKNLQALKDVNFSVEQGEFFGVIGRNGSGKSTLLKVMAGIYQPSRGGVIVNGSLTPFIELGIGFNQELTGRDNVFLNGAILGLTRSKINQRYNDIVAFAELEKFMDQKLKNYSSGMQVRLAFSVAIQAHSDILLIDEVLAVGDLSFQNKCFDYFRSLKSSGKTVVLVTHNMGVVREFCSRGIVLDKGKIVAEGKPTDIMPKYLELNVEADKPKAGLAQKKSIFNDQAKITRLRSLSASKNQTSTFEPKQKILVEVEFEALQPLTEASVGVSIIDAEGLVVFASSTQPGQQIKTVAPGERYRALFAIDNIYTDGEYRVSTAVSGPELTTYARNDFGLNFKIKGWDFKHSLVHPEHSVSIEKL